MFSFFDGLRLSVERSMNLERIAELAKALRARDARIAELVKRLSASEAGREATRKSIRNRNVLIGVLTIAVLVLGVREVRKILRERQREKLAKAETDEFRAAADKDLAGLDKAIADGKTDEIDAIITAAFARATGGVSATTLDEIIGDDEEMRASIAEHEKVWLEIAAEPAEAAADEAEAAAERAEAAAAKGDIETAEAAQREATERAEWVAILAEAHSGEDFKKEERARFAGIVKRARDAAERARKAAE